ncbi:hypothetical protein C0J52_21651 [Blattella germanica]|nr:hypothetical protein C0J52_21651 [Blattella germanica]
MTNEGNFEEVAEFKYLGALITNRIEIQKGIKHRLNSGNACYYALQRLLHWSAFQKFSEVTSFLGHLVYLVLAEFKNITHFA